MRKKSCFKFNRLFLTTLLILVFCASVLPGESDEKKTPAVGLIRFSLDVNVQKDLVEDSKKNVEKEIKVFLDTTEDFKFKKKFEDDQDVITYSDIEDPDVTLDPTFESRANKILKELSGKHELDAVVFGHFYEEEDFIKNEKSLIIVIRYYIADQKIPKDKRIVSLAPVEIKSGEITKEGLKKATKGLIEELKKKLKTQFEMKPPEETKPPIQETEERLTPKEIYQMIIDNGFHCETLSGSLIHDEAMKALKRPSQSKFKLKREVTSSKISKDLIETRSKIKFKPNQRTNTNIELLWNKGAIDLCTYENASKAIEKLNQKDQNKKWRIPTAMEIFSIIDPREKNNFPSLFEFHKKYENSLVFWTSTVLKKEGTKLGYEKDKKAQIVVVSSYDKKKDIYWVYFSSENLEKKSKAILLPVYSDIKRSSTNKIPGFDDNNDPPVKQESSAIPPPKKAGSQNSSKDSGQSPAASKQVKSKTLTDDKIPGFDDVPDIQKQILSGTKGLGFDPEDNLPPNANNQKAHQTVKIVIYPYTWKGEGGKSNDEFFNHINKEIKIALDDISRGIIPYHIENKLKGYGLHRIRNYRLQIEMKDLFASKDTNDITQFYEIFSGNGNSQNAIVNTLKSKIMRPQNIDFIVSVKRERLKNEAEISKWIPIIIYRDHKEIYTKSIVIDKLNIDSVNDYIVETLLKIILALQTNMNGV